MYTNSYDSFLNVRNGFPVFSTTLEANYVRKHEDAYAAFKLTDDDRQEIHRLARDPRIGARPALALSKPLLVNPEEINCLALCKHLRATCFGFTRNPILKQSVLRACSVL